MLFHLWSGSCIGYCSIDRSFQTRIFLWRTTSNDEKIATLACGPIRFRWQQVHGLDMIAVLVRCRSPWEGRFGQILCESRLYRVLTRKGTLPVCIHMMMSMIIVIDDCEISLCHFHSNISAPWSRTVRAPHGLQLSLHQRYCFALQSCICESQQKLGSLNKICSNHARRIMYIYTKDTQECNSH